MIIVSKKLEKKENMDYNINVLEELPGEVALIIDTLVGSQGAYGFTIGYMHDVIQARTGMLPGQDYSKRAASRRLKEIRECYRRK